MGKTVLPDRVHSNPSDISDLQFYELHQKALRLSEHQEWAGAIQAWTELAEASRDSEPSSYKIAKQELDALNGEGAFGRSFESFSRRIFAETMKPASLAGMALGSGIFSLSRGILLDRLFLSTSSFLTRGLGARALSGIAASALEASSCSVASRLVTSSLGNFPSRTFSAELAASFLSLGGMRLVGSAGHALAGNLSHSLARETISKGSTYLGILSGQVAEREMGLRPAAGVETALFDGASTWLQAHAGARLLGAALGPRWSAWQGEISARGEQGLRLPSSVKARPAALGDFGLRTATAISGALLCSGCEKTTADQWPLMLGLGALTGLGLRQYRRTLLRESAADAFHALPKKGLTDLLMAAHRATGLSPEEVLNVITTMRRYGAPKTGMSIDKAAAFKKVAIDLLRISPIKRRGGIPTVVSHSVMDPFDNRRVISWINGMPLAYADRIRAWVRVHLEAPEPWLAKPEQIASRVDILTNKIAKTFTLPVSTARKLVELILREPFGNQGQQKGQLFDGDFPALYDMDGYEFHLKQSIKPAKTILRQAGLGDRSIPWLKEVIAQLAADCQIPVPSYSMKPDKDSGWPGIGRKHRNLQEFYDHDWHAVNRLRDAVWGPWRLPWEEPPNESDPR